MSEIKLISIAELIDVVPFLSHPTREAIDGQTRK